MFDFFSLDFVYYPVSWIMWVWYKLFAAMLGPSNFFAWALSVMFLVFTLRALLYKPFVRQIRTTRQMQELQPQIKALQKKYGKDRQRMALEMQKLQREHGFNPILGCLPMLAQIPVFLGLYHVLRSFNRTTGGFGQPHLSVVQNRLTGNYVFTPTDVGHFLDANLFGAPIGAFMTQRTGLDAFTYFSRPAVIAVGLPVMILAGVATYFNSRASVARQSPEAAANPQTAMMKARAVRVSARRGGRWAVPAAGHHPVLVRQQHLDVRSAALRVRHDRKGRRSQEAGSDSAPRGQCPGAGRQAETQPQGGRGQRCGCRRGAAGRPRHRGASRRGQRRAEPYPASRGATEKAQTLIGADKLSGPPRQGDPNWAAAHG
ncbi:hypothetical protein JPH1_52070 [Mycobacterium avium subsp. hominissuis]|uniref:Membrane protein insertase YidC n=1 Tax=Mycobacterium avium subsp. hominissuis TaxID=439334 RepID=A0AAI8X5A5_MYCAV|nr:hypothetical protein JPH1_52070 [Mycobacterium avium subsp. hominissuis]